MRNTCSTMRFFQTTFSEQSLFTLAKVRLQVPYLCFYSLFVLIMNHNFTQRPTRLFQIFMAITNVARKKQEAKELVFFDRLWNPGIDARKLWLWNSHKKGKKNEETFTKSVSKWIKNLKLKPFFKLSIWYSETAPVKHFFPTIKSRKEGLKIIFLKNLIVKNIFEYNQYN